MTHTIHILGALRAALAGEPRIDLRHDAIEAAFEDGALTLSGEVGSVAAKKLALRRAAAVPGVVRLVDDLRVKPSRRISDAALRDYLCDAILKEPALAQTAVLARTPLLRLARPDLGHGMIGIEVQDGVVTLSGTVPGLAEKRLAGVLAWWAPGCRDVANRLDCIAPAPDSDADLTASVRLILEKDPQVDASRLRVMARGRTVLLRGATSSDAQRRLAESDVWYVLGVEEVDNRIDVRPAELVKG